MFSSKKIIKETRVFQYFEIEVNQLLLFSKIIKSVKPLIASRIRNYYFFASSM